MERLTSFSYCWVSKLEDGTLEVPGTHSVTQKKDEKRVRKRPDDIECLDPAIPEVRVLWSFLVIITNKIYSDFYS